MQCVCEGAKWLQKYLIFFKRLTIFSFLLILVLLLWLLFFFFLHFVLWVSNKHYNCPSWVNSSKLSQYFLLYSHVQLKKISIFSENSLAIDNYLLCCIVIVLSLGTLVLCFKYNKSAKRYEDKCCILTVLVICGSEFNLFILTFDWVLYWK